MSSIMTDEFYQKYKYFPQRLWKEWLGPKQVQLERTITEDHVPPLLRQQRQQMNNKLQKDVMDDRFLFFIRLLFDKVLQSLFVEKNLSVSQSDMGTFLSSFPKSIFRPRVNPHRSIFHPLPWKLLSKNMVPISSVFANVPILLQGSMNSIQYGQLLQSYFVGSLLNRIRYRIPFFLYTYSVLEVIPGTKSLLQNQQNQNQQQQTFDKNVENNRNVKNVLLLLTENPVSFSEDNQSFATLEEFLLQADITMQDFFHIFIQVLALLHHIQFYLGITIQNLSLDRILIRPTPSSFPSVFSFHMYGREFQLKKGNFLVQFRGWSDANFRDHANLLFSMNNTYLGSVEGKRSSYSASKDLFDFLVQVRQKCIQVLSPSMKRSNSTTWEYKLHVETILKFIHILWAQFYDFPTDSLFWLEQLPKNLSVYESLACSKTPGLCLEYIFQHASLWKGDLGIHAFPLTVSIRETLLPTSLSSLNSTRLPHVFEDFVRHDFYPLFEKYYRPMGWFTSLSTIPSLDNLEIEMNELFQMYTDQTISSFEFKSLLLRNGTVQTDTFTSFDKNYLRPSGPYFGKLKGTYAFVSRLVGWMENMYFLQSYRYEDFAKFQKRNQKVYTQLVKIFADPQQMLFFEQVLSYTETVRCWIDKYIIIKKSQTIIRNPFVSAQQQQKQQKLQQFQPSSYIQQQQQYMNKPRFLPPSTFQNTFQNTFQKSVQNAPQTLQNATLPSQSLQNASLPTQTLQNATLPLQRVQNTPPLPVQSVPLQNLQNATLPLQSVQNSLQNVGVPVPPPLQTMNQRAQNINYTNPIPNQQQRFIYNPMQSTL
jgi:hypothetical protein